MSISPLTPWYRYDGISYTEITGGSSPSYEIQQADIGSVIAFAVSIMDDAGNLETSEKNLYLDKTVIPNNSLAEFKNPSLTGGEHVVGKTLFADLEITDADGYSDSNVVYHWARYDGS